MGAICIEGKCNCFDYQVKEEVTRMEEIGMRAKFL
jgi:hypothetical protein